MSSGYKVMEKTWENIQKKTFTGWVNAQLKKKGEKITSLETDLSDGIQLIYLLEVISGEDFPAKYEKKPNLRIKKVANVGAALKFVESKGIKLVGISPEAIVDGNLTLILGLIWTIILRFQIQDISMEELSAKEALLLWCQRKTEGYKDVKVQNFHMSFQDGLALCALIHRHRPDLLDFNSLSKENKLHNLNLAFDIAEKHLGIPKLLDAQDIVEMPKPDERSIITYVSLYYHVFNAGQQADVAGRRIGKLIDFNEANERSKQDYSDRARKLVEWIGDKDGEFSARQFPNSLEGIQQKIQDLQNYKNKDKTQKGEEKVNLEALFNALQSKLSVNRRPPFVPASGLAPADIDDKWNNLDRAEHEYAKALLAEYRRQKKIKDLLRRFNTKLQKLEDWIGAAERRLPTEPLGDNLSAVRAKLKNHESFEEEYKAMNARNDTLRHIYAEIKALGYNDLASLDAKLQTKDNAWEHLHTTAQTRKNTLQQELERQQRIEDLLLDYAKQAMSFRVWANEADDQLSDPITVDTVQGIRDLQTDFDSYVTQISQKKSDFDHLNTSATELRRLGVQETHFSELSLDDVKKLWNDIQTLQQQRSGLLFEEAKRQDHHEQLRLEFARKAQSFHEYVYKQTEAVRGASGTPEDTLKQVRDLTNAFNNEIERYNELARLTQTLESEGITENPHTNHTIQSLRSQWNGLATLSQEKQKAIEKELAAANQSSLSAAQIKEFRDCFVHFDKDKDSLLNRLEFGSCLKSLGRDVSLDEGGALDTLLSQVDSDGDGKVSFDDFLRYMERLNTDSDTQDQINEAFSTLAGGAEFVTEAQLRSVLPAEKVTYLLKHMPPAHGQPGAYDYKSYTASAYSQ